MAGRRILALTPRRADIPSGAEVALLSLLQWLAGRGWDVSVVCGSPSPSGVSEGILGGVRVHYGHREPSIPDLCGALRPDAVILQLAWIKYAPGLRARGVATAAMLHTAGDASVVQRYAESISLVVPNCLTTAALAFGARRVHVLNPPLGDPSRWRARRPDVWAPGRPLVTAQVNLAEVKGGGLFRWLAGQLQGRMQFVGVQGGYGNQHIDAVPAGVRLVESVERIAEVLIGTDLLLAPSLSESYGMAVREALLSGVPVVASRLPGIEEAIGERTAAAVLLAPNDQAGWLAELERRLQGQAQAEAWAAAGDYATRHEGDEGAGLERFEAALSRAVDEDGGRVVVCNSGGGAEMGQDSPKHSRRQARAAVAASTAPVPVAAPSAVFAPSWSSPPLAAASRWPVGSKLHVGCGGKVIAGWLNTDTKPGVGPDGVVDLSTADLPAATFDAIYACHVLEHCFPEETPLILARCLRALRPGGTLRLAVPDLRKIIRGCDETEKGHPEYFGADLNAPLFGDYRRGALEPDRHRQGFTLRRLTKLLEDAGFVAVREWVPAQYPEIAAIRDWSAWPTITLNLEADRPTGPGKGKAKVDVSVLLGTVDRPQMLRECVESVRASLAGSGLAHEVVVAYGREDDASLPWMREQRDVVPVLGGMQGAIEAFNRAYRASKGRVICQINDDVLVDGDSLAKAVAYLDQTPGAAGVVFQYDRGDGKGYRNDRLGGALHPNQLVAPRETCEAVVERIGAFWGDDKHRTDKTYGGDSAFGAVCRHLGLVLCTVPGATCRDRMHEADDALRQANRHVAADHGQRWREMYGPMLTGPAVGPGRDEWPNIYLPRPGSQPRRSPVDAGPPERLLHLCGRNASEPLDSHREAFAAMGPTVELPWIMLGDEMPRKVLDAAEAHRPTLVWWQIQDKGKVDPALIRELRRRVPSDCLILYWSGDVRRGATQPPAEWQVELGGLLDLSLDDDCTEPVRLRNAGVRGTGYLQCGYCDKEFSPGLTAQVERVAVFTGTDYRWIDGGKRSELFRRVGQLLPGALRLHGTGWRQEELRGVIVDRPLDRLACAAVYRSAPVVVSQSCFDGGPDALRRYTSDRLRRIMGAGGVAAVRRFPDQEGLGLREGVNCLCWDTPEDLAALLKDWLRPERDAERQLIKEEAARVARENWTWKVAAENLLAIVRAERQRRRS
jgi:SAM-dependent methyltransferase